MRKRIYFFFEELSGVAMCVYVCVCVCFFFETLRLHICIEAR